MNQRLISPAEVRDAARQVMQDQSTWRDGNAAVAKMVAILTEPPAPPSPDVKDMLRAWDEAVSKWQENHQSIPTAFAGMAAVVDAILSSTDH
jgi:hypothetical protein